MKQCLSLAQTRMERFMYGSISGRETRLNVSCMKDPPKGINCICMSKWNRDGDSLEDLTLMNSEENTALGGLFPCGPLSLIEVSDAYVVLDGNEEPIYMSDPRMEVILPWLNNHDYDTDLFSLDQWLSVEHIPYVVRIIWDMLNTPTTYIWKDDAGQIVASVPPLTEMIVLN